MDYGYGYMDYDDLLWHYGNSWEYPRMMGIMDTIGVSHGLLRIMDMDYGLLFQRLLITYG